VENTMTIEFTDEEVQILAYHLSYFLDLVVYDWPDTEEAKCDKQFLEKLVAQLSSS
jgi:hypothetical protein